MAMKFEAAYYIADKYNRNEFDTADEAVKAVEEAGSGNVTKVHYSPNIPGMLPEQVGRSIALWVYVDKKWMARTIFGGQSCELSEELPH